MKIIQIAPVVEYTSSQYKEQSFAKEEATLYGLGDDGKPYVWALIKNSRIKLDEPDEDGNDYHYERAYSWRELS